MGGLKTALHSLPGATAFLAPYSSTRLQVLLRIRQNCNKRDDTHTGTAPSRVTLYVITSWLEELEYLHRFSSWMKNRHLLVAENDSQTEMTGATDRPDGRAGSHEPSFDTNYWWTGPGIFKASNAYGIRCIPRWMDMSSLTKK